MFVITGKMIWSFRTARVAINTLVVYEEFARDIIGPFF